MTDTDMTDTDMDASEYVESRKRGDRETGTEAGALPAEGEGVERTRRHRVSGIRTNGGRSIGELLRDVTTDTTTLVRDEVALARAEVKEKASVFQRNITSIAIGGALLLVALIILMTAVNRGLTVLLTEFVALDVAVWLAPLILAAILGIVGYALLRKGQKNIQKESVVPRKTAETIKEDTRWVREKVS